MKQTVHVCNEHEDCTVIIGGDWPDDAGSWCSHEHVDVEPKDRVADGVKLLDRR